MLCPGVLGPGSRFRERNKDGTLFVPSDTIKSTLKISGYMIAVMERTVVSLNEPKARYTNVVSGRNLTNCLLLYENDQNSFTQLSTQG